MCVVLAVVFGVAISARSGELKEAGPVVAPAGAAGERGLVIAVGKPDAPVTITAYEDFRCPGCAMVEKEIHEAVDKLEDEGKLRVEYHLLSFIDAFSGGKGSRYAAEAAASAQDAGKFREYHDVLFANQPDEQDDRFGDKKVLLDLAAKVDGLRTAKFAESVTKGVHDTWVRRVQHVFDRQNRVKATPSFVLDGTNLIGAGLPPLTAQRITRLVENAAKGKDTD
ncbi:thioredoxin domain-containing protein [Streptomyces sp. AV19]|uniref:DsbA family protein n=1 Tax=Streptomyces sp. AV19 TaxID=2793068 RepID=UPI0018FE4E3F|nr:thioredoxin domain-containing protein [Streptomyces sp. AV19]MBH1939199.1 thioredoxin domain-containing protein [Streptomyces sp. AV19]